MNITSLSDDSPSLREVGNRTVERGETNYGALALAWVFAATVVRLVLLAPIPLGNGEAYYYSWARFPDWSYYDHPPLVAWMARVTTAFGSSPALVRLGPVVCAAVFGVLFYRLAERLFRPRAAFFALVLVTALPMFAAQSFVLNPEAPLGPLWVAFLLAVERMRERDEPFRPLVAGLLLGCAFLAKYTAVLLAPAALLYLAASPRARRWLRRPSLYAGGGVALIAALPVIAWNHARGWPSVRLHLLDRVNAAVPVAGENTVNHFVEISSSSGAGVVASLLRVVVGQMLAYSPLLAPFLAVALVRSLRRARSDDRDRFLAAFSWPILLAVLAAMTSFKDAEQHWTAVALIPAAIGAGRWIDESGWASRTVRRILTAGFALSGAAFVIISIHVRTMWLARILPRGHYDPRADIVAELVGWDQVRAGVAQAARSVRGGRAVLASNHYSLCGRLLFEMGDDPPVYCPTGRRSEFDFFGRGEPPADATVIALTTSIHDDLPAGLRDRSCAVADQVDVERAGQNVARYFVHTCPPSAFHPDARASR